MDQATTYAYTTRTFIGLAALVLLCVLIAPGGCRPALLCVNDTNDLTINPQDKRCSHRCDCNNQKYEGYCSDEQKCIVQLRESCTAQGSLRACDHKLLKCKGYQRCQPTHLFLQVWGDCRCDLDPENPDPEPSTEPKDGGEHQMGGEKKPIDGPNEPPDRREVTPEKPIDAPESRPEPPDTCQPERCGDGLDNDCDGKIDEDCTPCAATQQLHQFKSHQSPGLALHHPWQPLVMTAGADGAAKLWDLLTGQEKTTLTGHTKAITAIAISPSGRRLATASEDGTVQLWDGQSFQRLRQFIPYPDGGTPRPVKDIAFHPRGMGFVTVADGADGVAWWDDSGRPLVTFKQTQQSMASHSLARFSPDGQTLALLGVAQSTPAQGVVLWWDADVTTPTYRGRIADLAPDRKVLAFLPGSQGLVTTSSSETQLWDLRTMKVQLTWPGSAYAVAWSLDGQRLAIAQEKDIALWHFQLQSLLARVPTTSPATAVSFSGDGAQLTAAINSSGSPEALVWTCGCQRAGAGGVCYSGKVGTVGRGICRAGQWQCDDQTRRTPCQNMQPPIPEAPDGRDDDCDGITDNGFVDLAVDSVVVTPSSGPTTTRFKLRVCAHNIGPFTSSADGVTARLYLSTDPQLTAADTPLTGGSQQPADLRWQSLAGGTTPDCKEVDVQLPSAQSPGQYFIGVIIDPDGTIQESDEANNTKATSLELKAP